MFSLIQLDMLRQTTFVIILDKNKNVHIPSLLLWCVDMISRTWYFYHCRWWWLDAVWCRGSVNNTEGTEILTLYQDRSSCTDISDSFCHMSLRASQGEALRDNISELNKTVIDFWNLFCLLTNSEALENDFQWRNKTNEFTLHESSARMQPSRKI